MKRIRKLGSMYQKICPVCGKKSYSASVLMQWICPYCGSDITEEPSEITD